MLFLFVSPSNPFNAFTAWTSWSLLKYQLGIHTLHWSREPLAPCRMASDLGPTAVFPLLLTNKNINSRDLIK